MNTPIKSHRRALKELQRQRREKSAQVRCLGKGPEHFFKSYDPRRERLCSKCRERIRMLDLGVAANEVCVNPDKYVH